MHAANGSHQLPRTVDRKHPLMPNNGTATTPRITPMAPLPAIICPNCLTNYRWDPNAAGMKVKCKCGAVIRIPHDSSGQVTIERMPGDSYSATSLDPAQKPLAASPETEAMPDELIDESGEYDLDELDTSELVPTDSSANKLKATPGRCPSCGHSVAAHAVLCMNCGYNLSIGRRIKTTVQVVESSDETARTPASVLSGADKVLRDLKHKQEIEQDMLRRHRITEWVLPMILLAVGPPALTIAAFMFTKNWQVGMLATGFLMGIELILMMPLLLLSLVIAAHIGGISFGSLWSALLKIAAISWGPGALADIVVLMVMAIIAAQMFLGAMAIFVVYAIFLGPPIAFLFDLDMQETRLTIGIITITRALGITLVIILWRSLF